MTSNKFLSMLSVLAAFAVVATITFNGYGLNRPAPPLTTVGQR